MIGSPLEGKTSVAVGFDQGYPIRHEFYPVEQILSLMGKQLVTPKSVIATVTGHVLPGRPILVCLICWVNLVMTILSAGICIASSNTVKLGIRRVIAKSVPAWFPYQTLLDVVKC